MTTRVIIQNTDAQHPVKVSSGFEGSPPNMEIVIPPGCSGEAYVHGALRVTVEELPAPIPAAPAPTETP